MFEFKKDHTNHTVKTVPSRKVASIIDDEGDEVERESIKWVDYCTDCEEVVE